MTKRFPALDLSTVPTESPVYFAQRYLIAAHDSVSSLIDESYPALRAKRKGGRGRLTHAESDLFRAAVVFAGAGVDAVLKQAMRDCIPIQIIESESARGQYHEFVTNHITIAQGADPKRLARLLTSATPRDDLREAYILSMTGSSLQSQQQVTAALAALGLQDAKELFKDSKSLNPLFKARNEIAHEMDMTEAALSHRGRRTRRDRALTTYIEICHDGLNYCQRVLNRLELEVVTDLTGE